MKSRLSPSLRKMLILTLCLSITTILVAVGFLISSYISSDKENSQREFDFVETRLKEINEELYRTNIFLTDALINNKGIIDINAAKGTHEKNIASRRLLDNFLYRKKYYNQNFSFMFWSPEKDVSVNCLDTVYSYANSTALSKYIRETCESGYKGNIFKWDYHVINDEVFILQLYAYEGNYICCWIPAKLLFKPIIENFSSFGGKTILFDTNDIPLLESDKDSSINPLEPTQYGNFSYYNTIPRMDVNLYITAKGTINFTSLIIPMIFVFLVVIIVLSFSGFTLFYYKHNIADPLKQFQKHISDFANTRETLKVHGFSELTEAMEIFDSLNEQINDLRIDIYEEQLTRAKTELAFFQQQIKPHFFVNCFSIIFGMAQKKDYERIQKFCLKLSGYIRYLFSDGFSSVTIKEELGHIEEYLEIQNIRSRCNIVLNGKIDEKLLNFQIPPLMLMSFVENSVKYSSKANDGLIVTLKISEANNKVFLSVTDNGQGFSEEALAELADLTKLSVKKPNTHIGTINVAKRLKLLYGDKFGLRFFNSADGGTCVEIILPTKL